MAAVTPKADDRDAEKMQQKEVVRTVAIELLNLKHTCGKGALIIRPPV